MAGGKTVVAEVLVLDENGKPAPLTPLSFSVDSNIVSWPDCKTDAFGKVVFTWPDDPRGHLCEYSVGRQKQTGRLLLKSASVHEIRIKLSSRPKPLAATERKFEFVKNTETTYRHPELGTATRTIYHAGGEIAFELSAFLSAMMLDPKTGEISSTHIHDDGRPFSVAATKWERDLCLPLGKTHFVPVVDTSGALIAWYNPLVSADHLFLIVPPLFLELAPDLFPASHGSQLAELTLFDPKGSVEGAFFRYSKHHRKLGSLGYFGGSGGDRFGVLFGPYGKVLSVHAVDPKGGQGDPLFDKVALVFGLGQLVKGLVIRLAKGGLKYLTRKEVSRTVDDVVDDTLPLTSASAGKLSLGYGMKVADHLVKTSPWLQELKRIKTIRNIADRNRAISKFIDDYKRGTGVSIKIVPERQAAEHGLTAGNPGTYLEKEKIIYMSETAWTNAHVDLVKEIGHEVGAAEIGRVMKILKEQIPTMELPEPLTHLTHAVDMALK